MGKGRAVGARSHRLFYFAVLPLAFFASTWAATAGADTTARQVLDQVRKLSRTTPKWSDRVQRLSLRIIDRRGGERNRALAIYLKKYDEDRTRTVVFFETPPEVKGVGFLQWADPHAKDEQWLYLPELKRARQISAGAKRESFVGTDFSYEDLAIITQITDWTDADAHTALVRDEAVDGQACHVIEFTPAAKDVSYGRIVVWITTKDTNILKFTLHDKAGRMLKVLTMSDIRNVGNIPTPFHMEVRNEETGSHTIVDFTEVKYDTGLHDDMFTQRGLEHGL
jgi:outer membrane lipoprotein-sorting protein